MKFFSIYLFGMIMVSHIVSLTAEIGHNHGVYYDELKALKTAPVTKLMFDEDAHSSLSEIQRDIIICKNLTAFQRFVRSVFLALDVIVVTPETMPLLYSYVDDICKKADIATPTVFITRKDGFFNAFAQKLLMSTGGIVIGQKLMNELSDEAIEAVVAHEIGHIKHNHVNKHLGLFAGQVITFMVLFKRLGIQSGITSFDTLDARMLKQYVYWGKIYLLVSAVSYIAPLIVNKRFEKEADEFAYKANGKGAGIIEFFELLLTKDQLREEEFTSIYALLQANKSNLALDDYYGFLWRYYVAYAGHLYTNFYKEIYYETFIGAHPSPQARIAAAKEYMTIKNPQ